MSYKTLLIPPLLLFFICLSWLHPLTSPYWNAFDSKGFAYLNSWVQTSPFWQNFWAFAGHQFMDWVHDVAMFLFFFFNILFAPKHLRTQKIAELLFSSLFILTIIELINGFLFPEWIAPPRNSPTLTDPTAFRLGSVIHWIHVKDHSNRSFPGDHATTAALFASLMFYLMGKRVGLLAIVYAIFFSLPRLVAGAHWLTDVLIGSLSIAILSTSLAFGTPFASKSIAMLEKGIKKFKVRRI